MAYGRVQRPVIAAAIQRSVSSGINNHSGLVANSNLRRYLRRIFTVLLVTVLYTAFVYTHGTTHHRTNERMSARNEREARDGGYPDGLL